MSNIKAEGKTTGDEIAVIGMSGRFPKAADINEFWDNLKKGKHSISFLTDEELKSLEPTLVNNPNFVKVKGGLLEDRDCFDASFFNYTPLEALVMDPQLRVFHECAWAALEDAGYDPGAYRGLIGLYAGASSSTYWEVMVNLSGKSAELGRFEAGNLSSKDSLCTQVSYKLDLRGPSAAVQTACSTSLATVHLACQSLLEGECDMALAGGVTIFHQEPGGYVYQEGMVMSPDGFCRAFDAKARGIVAGSGAALVLLKPLAQALEQGDHIYAVVKATAMNNDGLRKANYTAPSIDGQVEVIRTALQVADIDPGTISYVEAHGTGTELGDPIEIEALKLAFNAGNKKFCAIGSVKTNIGHVDSAAGAAGFIKTVLALKHRLIPPSLHFETPNPKIDFDNSPFYVNTTLKEWKNNGNPLRAGVSSFGIGGTNVHVILEETPQAPADPAPLPGTQHSPGYQLILFSAKTSTALDKIIKNLANFFKENPGSILPDAAYTLQTGRQAFTHRGMLVCKDKSEAINILSTPTRERIGTAVVRKGRQSVVFMFSGQGSQYVGMARDIYQTEPLFRQEIDTCIQLLTPIMGCNVKEILYPGQTHGIEEAREKLKDILYSGPVKFIVEYSLAKLLMKWGIQPQAMIGHSFGEYTAASLAGVFSLEDALKLVALRGKLLKKLSRGLMTSVPLPEHQVTRHLHHRLYLAAVNTADQCIVSGPEEEVRHFENQMKQSGYDCVRLNLDRAGHCPMMEPILEEFEKEAAAITFNEPQIPYISGITGTWIQDKQAVDLDYWSQHMKETIRFYHGIKELLKIENPIFVHPGPDRGITSFVDKIQEGRTRHPVMNLVRHHKEKTADDYYLLNRLGELWHYGVSIDWRAFHAGEARQRISLPTYPFARQPYWLEEPGAAPGSSLAIITKQLPGGKKPDIADWFYLPSWKQTIPRYPGRTNSSAMQQVHWWLFTDEPAAGVGAQLAAELEEAGHHVVTVRQGQAFKKENPRAYTLNPLGPGGYNALVKALTPGESSTIKIIHLWGVTGTAPDQGELEKVQAAGFYSLLHLLQALEKHQVSQDIQLTVITDHLQSVTGEEYLNPGKSTVMGLIRVAPQEYPNISGRCIDIAVPPGGITGSKKDELIKPLLGELMAEPSDQEIAFRGGYKWMRTYEPIRLEETPENSKAIKKQGVYLIIGGFGIVGTILSGYLAGQYQAKLVLTGQQALPDRDQWQEWLHQHGETDTLSQRIKKIQELEAQGAEVMAFGADAANRQQMRQVIHHTMKRFGRIDGVIFSVVLPDERIYKAVSDLDKPTCEQQFHAKVNGILVLEELLKDIDIDFCLVMSSISAVLGGLGFTGYSAANNFIDYWVLHHNKVSLPQWISVDWDGWLSPGQSTGKKSTSSLGTSLIELSMTPEEGARAFERVLSAAGVHRLVQSTGDIQPRILRWINPKPEASEEPMTAPTAEPGQKAPRRDLTSAYEPPAAPTEKALTEIWQTFFGYEKVGIHDDFFEMGGDSLKALQMVSLIHKKLSVRVPVKEFFAHTTAAELAGYIDGTKTSQHYSIEPAEKKEYYALSSAQKRLYFLQQMDPHSTAYNVPLVLPLAKDTVKNKLETALKKLLARHDSLRTSFEKVNEVPVQRVYHIDALDFSLDSYEASMTGAEEIFRNYTRPFDLSQAPLIRSAVVKLTTGLPVWLLDMHHIISDGTSCTILTEDFLSLYNGEELAPLRIQYKEFAQWQNHLFDSGAIKVQSDYWMDLYWDSGEIPALQLPVDYKRPEVFTFAGDSFAFKLEPGDEDKFKQLSLRHTGTLYMNILAALNTLFHKYTTQTDIIIGTSIAGRPHIDLQSITGMFVNTLAMRNYPRGEKTYETLLEEVKENSIKAFENQDVQFEDLVDKLKIERDPSRNPMFDICMVVQNFKKPGEQNQGRENFERKRKKLLPVEEENQTPIIYGNLTSKFDMAFFVEEQEKDIHFNIEYYTAIFKPDTIKRLVSHLKNIIRAVIKQPGIKIKDIQIMSPPEKKQVLFQFNDTAKPYPGNKTIHELFEQQVEQTPDNTALIGPISDYQGTGGFLTYNELNKKSNQLANYLVRGKQVLSGHCVGILMDRSIELIIAILGILKAGAAYVPLDTAYPEERLKNIIDDAAAGVVISRKNKIKTLNRLQWECPAFQTFLCLDSTDIYKEEEVEKSGLMDEKLWEYVGESAVDDITAGGWLTSTTGQPFSREEMDEYGDNILKKMKPFLHPEMRVLEIGCASGLTMYRIAPLVGLYYGTDLSRVIIEKNREIVKEQGHDNIKLACLPAHDINRLREKDFDLVIINSVIQSFHGHNYLRSVIDKVLNLMAPQGYLFIGDVMDRDMKGQLIRYLEAFKQTHPYKNYTTKTDWSQELFISRGFFQDLTAEFPQIHDVEFSPKIYTIENELTLFRYDALLKVEKNAAGNQPLKPLAARPKHKYQEDLSQLRQYPGNVLHRQESPGDRARQPAYVIYTSGTSGRPKGVLVEHRSVVRLVKNTNIPEWKEGHRLLPTGATAFDISTFEIWAPLLNRVPLVLVDNPVILNGEALEKVIQTYQVTHLHLTPQLFEQLAPGCPGIFQRLHCFLVGGDRVRPRYVNEIQKKNRQLKILHMYGPTENTTFSTYYPVDREHEETLPIGRPIANTRVYIMDSYQRLQPVGVYGELCTAGPGTARGYLNNPELTTRKFLVSNKFGHHRSYRSYKSYIYRTGDMARWLPDGNIELLGRIDSQVKIRGYRIETQEIEKILLTHPQVLDCVVEARDIKQDKQLVAYYVTKNKIRLWPSLAEYFVYDDLLYNSMTRDQARNKKYRDAIAKVIKGKTVLEIGPGSEAILSRICIEEGAEKVYAVEILEEAYQKAKNQVKTLGLEDRIILIHGDINEVKLPEPVDYCISEIVGSIGGSEGAAGIINTARGFLKDPTHMIPARSLTKIAAITLPPSEFEASFEEVGAHYVQKVFDQVGYKFDLRLCLYSFPAKHVISTDDVFEDLDFTRENLLEEEHDIYLEIQHSSILNGFVVWLNLYLDDEEVIDSLEIKYIWLPIYLPVFSRGEPVEKGDYIRASVARKLSGSGVNPDFTISGQLHKRETRPIDFSYHCPHINKEFKSNPFYKEIFANNPLKVSGKVPANDIKDFLTAKLPGYMVPAYLVEIEKIPITPNGKVNKKELPEPGIGKILDYTPPTNRIEKKLREIWTGVLGIEKEQISINSNFFDLGGHSLKATILTSKIHKELQVKVPLAEVFKRQTIKGLSGYIKEAARAKYRGIQPLEKKEYYQLSSAQKRLYFLQQMDPESTAYNMTFVHPFGKELEIHKLQAALNKLVARHESLRTSFESVNEAAVQRVYQMKAVDFSVDEYEAAGPAGAEEILKNYTRSFDLSQAPLMRSAIIKLPSLQCIWLVDMHHIISDGTSHAILTEDFISLYNGEELEPQPIQYKDFARWQNDLLASGAIKSQENYWLELFQDAGEIPRLQLPADYKRPGIFTYEGEIYSFKLGQEDTEKFKRLNFRHGGTLYMNLLAALNTLFYKYTGQEDIIIGSGIAGRPHAKLQSIVGMCVNTLAMRNRPAGDKTYEYFLKEVIRGSIKAYENQDVQFEELVDKLEVERDTSRHPLFDIFLIVQNFRSGGEGDSAAPNFTYTEPIPEPGENHLPVEYKTSTAIFDLTFSIAEVEEEINIDLGYYTGIFKPDTIKRLVSHFKNVIKAVIKNPGIKLSTVEIMTAEEKNRVLHKFNKTSHEYPAHKTIHECFEKQIERTPHQVALIGPIAQKEEVDPHVKVSVTYGELNRRADRIAGLLTAKGVRGDIIVGLMAERSIEMIVGLLGILKAGGAYLPLDPDYPQKRINYMLADSKVRFLLTDNPSRHFNCQSSIVNCQLSMNEETQPLTSTCQVNPANLAYIIYTSGTTGQPKGCMVAHQNLISLLKNKTQAFDFSENDVWTMFHRYNFDFSVWEMYGALLYGGKLIIVPKQVTINLERYLELLKRKQVTVLNQTPSAFYQLSGIETNQPDSRLNLRYVIFGGEALSPLRLKKWKEKYPATKLVNMFGITETTIHVTYKEIGREDIETKTSNIGRPLPTLSTYVMDRNLNLQPIGIPGELYVAGEGVARGYLNNPGLTNQKFLHGAPGEPHGMGDLLGVAPLSSEFSPGLKLFKRPPPGRRRQKLYKSGDLARRLSSGDMEYLGRIDHQVKIRGFRIEPAEIETCLLTHNKVKQAIVLARKDENSDKYLCAYIRIKGTASSSSIGDSDSFQVMELKEYLSARLPGYMVPAYFVVLEKIPLTMSGKIDTPGLPEPEKKAGGLYTAPGNEVEETLAGLWSEVVGMEKTSISIDANFFSLGGHSLKATILINRIHQALNVKISLVELFKQPTIRAMAGLIGQSRPGTFTPIKPVEKKEYYALSSAQKRLLIQQNMQKNNIGYNLPRIVVLEGRVDRRLIEETIKKLINRHENLGTSFHIIDNQPVQRIHFHAHFAVEYYEKKEEEAGELIDSFVKPFDPGQAPLLRVRLIKTAEARYLLMYDMHHIITDGISMEIFIKEFTALYTGEKLPPLRIQYKDFSRWQNSRNTKELIKQQEDYWLKEFAGNVQLLNLPVDFEWREGQERRGDNIGMELDKQTVDRLKSLATREGATLYIVMLTIVNILLAKECDQEEVIIGSPIAGRRHRDLEPLIGFFINMLPMRNFPTPAKTFHQLLEEIKNRTLKVYENQDYQFEDLVDKVLKTREANRNSLVDVVFVLQNFTAMTDNIPETAIGDFRLSPYPEYRVNPPFDLAISGFEDEGKLEFIFYYLENLFEKKTIQMIIQDFKDVVTAVLDNNDILLKDIRLSHDLAVAEPYNLQDDEGDFQF